jgi:hypothetical protein
MTDARTRLPGIAVPRRWPAIAVVIVSAIWSHPAHACSCHAKGTGPLNFACELRSADAVFSGTVLQIQEFAVPTESPLRLVVFDVTSSWKGVHGSRAYAFTGTGGGDCGYPFTIGRQYIVWANRSGLYAPGELNIGICSPTRPFEEARDQIRQLGEPRSYASRTKVTAKRRRSASQSPLQ